MNPRDALDALGAIWSPDFDAYAAGELDASRVRCALCERAPCQCPPFGTPEYFALIDRRHGRRPAARGRREARAIGVIIAQLDAADARATFCRTCGFTHPPDPDGCPRWRGEGE